MSFPRGLASVGDPTWNDTIDQWICTQFGSIQGNFLAGDNPTEVAYGVFVIQFILISSLYLALRFILSPLRQPKYVCSVLAGILISPILQRVSPKIFSLPFPPQELLLARTLGTLGTCYLLFLTAVRSDMALIRHSLRNGTLIGLSSLIVPLVIILILVRSVDFPGLRKGYFRFIFSAGLSVTRFPNVVYAFEELNIMTSDLGQLAVSCSVLSEILVWSWALLGLYYGERAHVNAALLATLVLLFFVFCIIRPVIMLIIRKTPEGKSVRQDYVLGIVLCAMILGVITDMIGGMQFGLLLLGLVIPNGPPLGVTLHDKIEAIVLHILMPMFYAVIGYNVDLNSIDMEIFQKMFLLTMITALTKLLGALVGAFCCKMKAPDSILIGLMLNIKGPFDLILFNRWYLVRRVNKQMYTMTVLCDVLVTAIVTPLIDILYNPHARLSANRSKCTRSMQTTPRDRETRMLCCIHNEDNVPGIISLLETSCPTVESPICAYAVHLQELVGQATPLMIPHNNKKRTRAGFKGNQHIIRAFENYSRRSNNLVTVKPYTVIAPYKSMHEYICKVAREEYIPLVIIPFHGSQESANTGRGMALRNLSGNLQAYAPCTVGTLLDKGMHNCTRKRPGLFSCEVAVIFIDGADDREALALAIRMVERPNVSVDLFRIIFREDASVDTEHVMDKKLDSALIYEFRATKVDVEEGAVYHEVPVDNAEETITRVRELKDKFDLIIVGKKRRAASFLLEEEMMNWSENPELGVLGDLVASSDFGGERTSVLVMQHSVLTFRGPFRSYSGEREEAYLLYRPVY